MAQRICLLFVAISVTACSIYTYRNLRADETRIGAALETMKGTYLIFAGSEYSVDSPTSLTPMVDPSVIEIGTKKFLTGKVSGKVENVLKDSISTGMQAFVAIDSIIKMEEVRTK